MFSKKKTTHNGPLLKKIIYEPRHKKTKHCICNTKDANKLCSNCTADQHPCFLLKILQLLFNINPKFQGKTSSETTLQVCVGPVRKPHCWFSHNTAQVINNQVVPASSDLEFLVMSFHPTHVVRLKITEMTE